MDSVSPRLSLLAIAIAIGVFFLSSPLSVVTLVTVLLLHPDSSYGVREKKPMQKAKASEPVPPQYQDLEAKIQAIEQDICKLLFKNLEEMTDARHREFLRKEVHFLRGKIEQLQEEKGQLRRMNKLLLKKELLLREKRLLQSR